MNNAHETAAPAPAAVVGPQPSATPPPAPAVTARQAPPVVVSQPATVVTAEIQLASTPSPMKKKKKKRKANYRNLIAGAMKQSEPRDIEKDKESIQNVTGGGAFMKIDKI